MKPKLQLQFGLNMKGKFCFSEHYNGHWILRRISKRIEFLLFFYWETVGGQKQILDYHDTTPCPFISKTNHIMTKRYQIISLELLPSWQRLIKINGTDNNNKLFKALINLRKVVEVAQWTTRVLVKKVLSSNLRKTIRN